MHPCQGKQYWRNFTEISDISLLSVSSEKGKKISVWYYYFFVFCANLINF